MSSGGGNFGGQAGSVLATPISMVSQGFGQGYSDISGQSAIANTVGQMGNAQLAQQQADRSQALGLMAPTAQEIQQLQQAMSVNAQGIQQSQALISSASPALQEAGKQALSLMNGGSAASLAPIQNQRAQQRTQLQQQLQQQLGPGYQNSTAGIQALNNFDQQTSNLMTNAQQSTIGQYLGTSQSAYSMGQAGQQYGIGNYMAGNNQAYGWQQGQANALSNFQVNPALGYAGQLTQNQANSSNIMGFLNGAGLSPSGLGQMGRSAAMGGMGGGGAGGAAGGQQVAGGPMDGGGVGGMSSMTA